MQKRLVWMLCGILMLAALIGAGQFVYHTCQHLALQFTPEAEYDLNSIKVLPNGVRGVQYICDPLESALVELIYRGKQIDPAESEIFQSELPYDTLYNVKYYRVRGLDNLSAMIVKSDDCPIRIVVPCHFSRYCGFDYYTPAESCDNHNAIFRTILSDFYGCEDASDIAAVRVEALPAIDPRTVYTTHSSAYDFKWDEPDEIPPVHITDPERIGAILEALTDCAYISYGFGVTGHSPFMLKPCGLSEETVEYHYNTGSYKSIRAPRYHVFLEFHDGSVFCLQYHSGGYSFRFMQIVPREDAFGIPRCSTSEQLYFHPDQKEAIWELLGIEQ